MKQPALNPWFDIGDTVPLIDLKLSDGKPKPPNRMAGTIAVVHVSDDAGAETAAAALEKRRGALEATGERAWRLGSIVAGDGLTLD